MRHVPMVSLRNKFIIIYKNINSTDNKYHKLRRYHE